MTAEPEPEPRPAAAEQSAAGSAGPAAGRRSAEAGPAVCQPGSAVGRGQQGGSQVRRPASGQGGQTAVGRIRTVKQSKA